MTAEDKPHRRTKSVLQRAIDIAVALAFGTIGGGVFYALGMPLPWTLGAMSTGAIVAICLARWPMPIEVRRLTVPLVGVLAGSSFSPESIELFVRLWPALLFVVIYTLLTSVIGYFYFLRVAGFDRVTAYFSATPGGLGELTIIGSLYGASMRTLVLVHSTRVLGIVFAIPLLLQWVTNADLSRRAPLGNTGGFYDPFDLLILIATGVIGVQIGRLLKVPGSILIGTMLTSAAVHASGITDAVPPGWLVAFAQILIGSVAGARFTGLKWVEFRTTILFALGWCAVLIIGAVGASMLVSRLLDMPFTWILLSIAPGGTAEVIIITFALGADVAFVATAQVTRIVLVITGAPLFFRALQRFIRTGGQNPPSSGGY